VPRPVALVLALIPVVLAPAAPVPKGADGPVLYYPTTVGTKWVYQRDGSDELIRTTITAAEEKDGGAVLTIGLLTGDKANPYWKVFVSPKGLFSGDGGLDEQKFPNPLLKLPVKAGEKWEVPGKPTRTVVGAEEVEVPAGKFRAVRVESEGLTEWFAPNVGCVQTVARSANGETKTVLKTFAPGK
jgi:hypothetical protein